MSPTNHHLAAAYYNDGVDNQLNKAIEVMNGKLGDGQ